MRTKWTNELLKEEALKYDTRSSFVKNNASAYNTSIKRGILDEICIHMTRFYWTNELLKEEALKYDNKTDFYMKSSSAYNKAYKDGILDEICYHMTRLGNIYNRFVYTLKFENNSVYVGLTCDLERRKSEHIKYSSNKYINEYMSNNVKYNFISDNILYNIDDAILHECFLIDDYKERGYNVLNIVKGGGLGGSKIKWTYDFLKEEALKYNTRSEFVKGNGSAYGKALKMCILDEICEHMSFKYVKWTYELLKEEALKYNTRSEFKNSNNAAYYASQRIGILNEICEHMSIKYIKWTYDILREEALKYNTRSEFKNKKNAAYQAANSRGILDEICEHMNKKES